MPQLQPEAVLCSDHNTLMPQLAFRRDGDRVYLANIWCQGSVAGLAIPLPRGVTEIVEREPLTLEATMTGGI